MGYVSRSKKLRALSKDSELYFSEVFANDSVYIKTHLDVIKLLRYTSEDILSTGRFKEHFGQRVVEIFDKQTSEYPYKNRKIKHAYKYYYFLVSCYPNMFRKHIDAILDSFIKNRKYFISQSSGCILKLCMDNLDVADEARVILILNNFYRRLSMADFKYLISVISGGIDNPDIANIFSKTTRFHGLIYNEEAINNNDEIRISLLKGIVKTPATLSGIGYNIYIKKSDIVKMPTITRYNFLRRVFSIQIGRSYGISSFRDRDYEIQRIRGIIKEQLAKSNLRFLIMPYISIKEMRNFMFPVLQEEVIQTSLQYTFKLIED